MSVYPLYLVLGSDGTIGAYATESLLQIDLMQNKRAGEPARQVFKLSDKTFTVTYDQAREYAEFILPIENLCDHHKREALPAPTAEVCAECEKNQKASGA